MLWYAARGNIPRLSILSSPHNHWRMPSLCGVVKGCFYSTVGPRIQGSCYCAAMFLPTGNHDSRTCSIPFLLQSSLYHMSLWFSNCLFPGATPPQAGWAGLAYAASPRDCSWIQFLRGVLQSVATLFIWACSFVRRRNCLVTRSWWSRLTLREPCARQTLIRCPPTWSHGEVWQQQTKLALGWCTFGSR